MTFTRCSDHAGDIAEGRAGDDDAAAARLEQELNDQDRLFLKCLRSRMEREARRKKEAQEKKEADERKRKAALESAFENEVDDLLRFFEEGYEVETVDLYGSTLLSEAAAGGADECVDLLLGSGADPNSLGRNKRTPVWRAANAGHTKTLQSLLRGGGDPRTPDDCGVLPYNVANGAQVRMLLECWDVSVTESIRQSFMENQKRLVKEREAKEKKQTEELKDALASTERRTEIAKVEVGRMQRLVAEYRQQAAGFAQKGDATRLAEVQELLARAEVKLAKAYEIHMDLEWQVKRARLKVRDFDLKLRRRARKAGEAVIEPQQTILLRDLADVVTKDVGGRRKEDGRWPLVFDPTGKAATFFTYCGAGYFDVEDLAVLTCSEDPEEQTRFLLSMLKHLMYGGMVVIHLGPDVSRMSIVEEAFNAIERGLFNTITDRAVLYQYLLPRRFMSLVPEERKNDFSPLMFEDEMLSKFVLAFVVSSDEPAQEVMEQACHPYYVIKVKDPDADAADLVE